MACQLFFPYYFQPIKRRVVRGTKYKRLSHSHPHPQSISYFALASIMLTLKASYVVKPAEPIPDTVMYLSDCDQSKSLTHAPTIYFYRPTTHVTLEEAVQTLKDSLSKALVEFYPLAGHLSWTEGGRVKLHCSSKGALLIAAEVELKIDDFGDFRPTPELRALIPSVDYATTPIDEVPLLLVQVTKFSCGGISLGLGMSHIIIDGQSALHFVTEWAKIARGEKSDDHPFLDRTLLQQNEDEYQALPTLRYSDLYPLPILIGQSDNLEERKKETTAIMLKLSKEQVEALKNKANQDLGSKEIIEALKDKGSEDIHGKTEVEVLKNKGNQYLHVKEQVDSLKIHDNQDPHGYQQIEALKDEGNQDPHSKQIDKANQDLHVNQQIETFNNKANQDLNGKEQIEAPINKGNQDPHSKEQIDDASQDLHIKEQTETTLGKKAIQDLHQFQKTSNQHVFSRFQALAAHVWRCASKARMLKPEQETVLYVTIDFCSRLKPPLPRRYFGNSVMLLPVTSTVGELLSKPLSYASSKIRLAIENVTDEYVRSYLLCMKNIPNISSNRHFHTVGCSQGLFFGNPNMIITSWAGLPLYGADFGWGDEFFMGPGSLGYDGRVFIIPSHTGDGSFLVPLRLQVEHANAFERYFYEEIN